MYKFVIGFLLLVTIRAIAAPDAIEILKADAAASKDRFKIIRTEEYIKTINKVREAESGQKKSILTQENIVEAYKTYGANSSHLSALNGILLTYAKLVKEGKAADEQTLISAARAYVKLRMPFISEPDLEAKIDMIKNSPLIVASNSGFHKTSSRTAN